MQENPRHAQLLQGQVALITGASRGIGAATARLFARHGTAVGAILLLATPEAQYLTGNYLAAGGGSYLL